MDVTKLGSGIGIGLWARIGIAQAPSSPGLQAVSPDAVQDVASGDPHRKRTKQIEDMLGLALLDGLEKTEGDVERLQRMTTGPHRITPAPASQVTFPDPPDKSDEDSMRIHPPVTLLEAPETSPAKSTEADADFFRSKYLGAASFFSPAPVGEHVDVTVGGSATATADPQTPGGVAGIPPVSPGK